MARPRRLYIDDKSKKYFYLVKGKRKYIRKPKELSEKQLVKINIKNIVGEQVRKPKKRKKRIMKVQKKIDTDMSKAQVGSLPVYLFKEKQNFPTLESIVKNEKKDSDKESNKAIEDLTKKVEKFSQQLALPAPPSGQPPSGQPPSGLSSPSKAVQEVRKRKMLEELKKKEEEEKEEKKQEEATGKYRIDKALRILFGKKEPYGLEAERKKLNDDLMFEKNIKDIPDTKDKAKWADEIGKIAYKYDQTGSGSNDDGLFNDEISKILKAKIKNFVPVIPSDKVKDMIRYVKRGDKRFGFVINTNPSSSDGSGNDGHRPGHWRAVYIDNDPDFETIEYFDPLAEGPPEKSLVEAVHNISKKMNPQNMFKLKVNYLKRQADNTGTCGYHAIDFLNRRFNGEPWSSATGYDKYIEDSKPDDSMTGEKEINKKIEKYKSYL